MNIRQTIELYGSGTTEGALKTWETRDRGNALADYVAKTKSIGTLTQIGPDETKSTDLSHIINLWQSNAHAKIRSETLDYINGNKLVATPRAKTLLAAIAAAEPYDRPLVRSMTVRDSKLEDFFAKWKGYAELPSIRLAPSSFSSDHRTNEEQFGGNIKIHITRGSRSLSTKEEGKRDVMGEKEFIASGVFRVVRVNLNKSRGVVDIVMEQIKGIDLTEEISRIAATAMPVCDIRDVKEGPVVSLDDEEEMNIRQTLDLQSAGTSEGAKKAWDTIGRGKKEKEKAVSKVPKTEAPKAESNADNWKQTGPAAGSNPGGFFEDESGVKKYVKFYPVEERTRAEVLANLVYEAVGIPVPKTAVIKMKGRVAISSDIIDKPREMAKSEIAAHPDMTKGFIVDAYLANHDVTGLPIGDNIRDSGGRLHRIDNGGAFHFRAQGAKKDFYTNHPNDVPEIDSMRNPSVAREAGVVFKDLKEDDAMKTQAQKLVNALTDEKIHSMVKAVGFTGAMADRYIKPMIGRRDYIKKRFGL